MKKTFLLFLLCFVQTSVFAQTINPFVQDGKVWTYDATNFIYYWEETYSLEGDTVINSHKCLKLYFTCQFYNQDHLYKGAIFEKKNGKVYFIATGSTKPVLLYDFSCEPGTITKVGEFELRIIERKLAKYHGEYLNIFEYSLLEDEYYPFNGIEGIGFLGGGLTCLIDGYTPVNTGGSRFIRTCTVNDEIVFDADEFFKMAQYVSEEETASGYFPEGTKWTEIRLDTLMYDSWYSKVNGEWVPNFETIEYRVQGEYIDESQSDKYSCVYTNGSEWTDSLTLLIYGGKSENEINWYGLVTVAAFNNGQLLWPFCGQMYPLSFEVGTPLSSLSIETAGATGGGWPWEWDEYGIVEEIKEGDFGGVRPLNYSDVNGIRFIQGIGVASWNDGECIFGPLKPYEVLSGVGMVESNDRHYRSMLVHFERNGEVLYDVWPEKETTEDPVTFTQGQMATIILPTEPDASKGKYYRLDKCEDGQIIFEQELQPQARVPYIIIPNEDFSIDPSTMDLEGLSHDAVSIEGISFIGSYSHEEFSYQEGFYIDIIDTTPDCLDDWFGSGKAIVGPLRAYLQVNWDDPYTQGGTKDPQKIKEIVLHNHGTGLNEIQDSRFKIQNESVIFDLQGRKISGKPARGIYIEDGKKKIVCSNDAPLEIMIFYL